MTEQWWDYPSNFTFGGQSGLEVNSTGTLMQYINSATGHQLGLMLILMFGVIAFLSLKVSFSTIKALNAATVLIFFISIPVAMMGLLTWTWVALIGVIVIIVTLMQRSDAQMGL